MSLFKLFPSCCDLVDASIGSRLERCFEIKCAQAGVALNAQAAERIGMRLLADAVSGLPSTELSALSWVLMQDDPRTTLAERTDANSKASGKLEFTLQ